MRVVTELKNTKKGKTAIIVGGGMSVNDFPIEDVDREQVEIIAINDSLYYGDKYRVTPDYLIYGDKRFTITLEKMNLKGVDVIADANVSHPRAKYIFFRPQLSNVSRVRDYHNTGVKAILLADLMGYDEIYLIGIDLYAEDRGGVIRSHHQGDRIGKGEKYHDQDAFQRHVARLNVFIKEFSIAEHVKKVYNMNENSRLKLYGNRELPQKLFKRN